MKELHLIDRVDVIDYDPSNVIDFTLGSSGANHVQMEWTSRWSSIAGDCRFGPSTFRDIPGHNPGRAPFQQWPPRKLAPDSLAYSVGTKQPTLEVRHQTAVKLLASNPRRTFVIPDGCLTDTGFLALSLSPHGLRLGFLL